jgi:hypothetical protein
MKPKMQTQCPSSLKKNHKYKELPQNKNKKCKRSEVFFFHCLEGISKKLVKKLVQHV